MTTAVGTLGTTIQRGADIAAVTVTTSSAATITNSGDNLFTVGDRIKFTAITGPTNVNLNDVYYVLAASLTATTFQIAATRGGSAITPAPVFSAGTVQEKSNLIAQVQDVSGPDLSTDTDEITNHDSPGGVEEFIPTIKRTGEITFPVVFDGGDNSHDEAAGVIKGWEDKSLDAYKLRYPDAHGWDFSAYIVGISMSAPVDGHLMADITLRPSGAPTHI